MWSETPIRWREGVFQVRPVLGGWQWRYRPYGHNIWQGWVFCFGSKERCQRKAQEALGPKFIEVPYED